MATLTNGVETIEEGSTLWRVIINAALAKLDALIGSVGSGSKCNQVAAGTKNGVNLVFTTPGAEAYVSGTMKIYYNGLKVPGTNFVETTPASGVFTFIAGCAPATGSTLEIDYSTP